MKRKFKFQHDDIKTNLFKKSKTQAKTENDTNGGSLWNETLTHTLQSLLYPDCLNIVVAYGIQIDLNGLLTYVRQNKWYLMQVYPPFRDMQSANYIHWSHWCKAMQISDEERLQKYFLYRLIYMIQQNNKESVQHILNDLIREEISKILENKEEDLSDLITFFLLITECSWDNPQNELMNKDRWMSFIMWILLYLKGFSYEPVEIKKEKYPYDYEYTVFVHHAFNTIISENIYFHFFNLNTQLNNFASSILTTTGFIDTGESSINKYITILVTFKTFEKFREEACLIYQTSWQKVLQLFVA